MLWCLWALSRLQVLEFEAQVNVVHLHIALNVFGSCYIQFHKSNCLLHNCNLVFIANNALGYHVHSSSYLIVSVSSNEALIVKDRKMPTASAATRHLIHPNSRSLCPKRFTISNFCAYACCAWLNLSSSHLKRNLLKWPFWSRYIFLHNLTMCLLNISITFFCSEKITILRQEKV